MTYRWSQTISAILLCVGTLVPATGVPACNVPVFRYALEFWPAARYEAVVFHQGRLSAVEQQVVDWLDDASATRNLQSNFVLKMVNLDDPRSATAEHRWIAAGKPKTPCLALYYPSDMRIKSPIWLSDLSPDNARSLADSPARRETAKRLLNGHSAVWVLIESGDAEKDAAVKAQLEQQLVQLERTLPLSTADVNEGLGGQPEPISISASLPMNIRFSLLAISRSDPMESLFIQMLLHSEPDLSEFESQPMVFPIYGRGRALYALVGKGITHDNIREAGEFLLGPCSCQAKALNPGTDLLITTDWESGLVESAAQQRISQPLIGLSSLVEISAEDRQNGSRTRKDEEAQKRAPEPLRLLGIGVLAAVALMMTTAGALTFIISRQSTGRRR